MTAAVPVPIRVRLGLGIKAHRLRRGMTQGQLAEGVNVSEQAISNIERAYRSPSLETLEKIAGALEVEVRDLFPGGAASDAQDEATRRIIAQLAPLTPEELAKVEAVVAAMLR